MLDWILNLWKTKPTIFWVFAIILIPFGLLVAFKGLAMDFLAAKANQTTKDAQLKDKAFSDAIVSLSIQANKDQQEADALGQEAATNTVSPDWNVKK